MFLSLNCGGRPWRIADGLGSIVGIRLCSLMDDDEIRMIVITLEGNFYVFEINHLISEYDSERTYKLQNKGQVFKTFSSKDIAKSNVEEGIFETVDIQTWLEEADFRLESQFDQNVMSTDRKSSYPGEFVMQEQSNMWVGSQHWLSPDGFTHKEPKKIELDF